VKNTNVTSNKPGQIPPAANSAVRGVRASGWPDQTRSEVLSTQGMVATSQPLAAQVGLRILRARGNAIDAAVATAAMLSVVEPMMVGPASDLFALIYIAKEKRIHVLNASGTAPRRQTVEFMESNGYRFDPANYGPGSGMPAYGILTTTVPGGVWGWHEALQKFGTMSFKQVLQPAIEYARRGFPVSERIAFDWLNMPKGLNNPPDSRSGCCQQFDPDSVATWYIDGKPPSKGQIFRNPHLAHTFKLLQKHGPDVFYKGEIAKAIIAKSDALGGVMTMDDLAAYRGQWVDPIASTFGEWNVNELPPPSQGWVAQLMLNILTAAENKVYPGETLATLGPTDPRYWHLLLEAKKLAFADLLAFNGDPDFNPDLIDHIHRMLTPEYAQKLASRIQPDKALPPAKPVGAATDKGDTIVLTTADREGNQVAWVNSLYWYFGAGITVRPYGFALGNRGALFSLDRNSPNVLAPNKRPFNTLSAGFLMGTAGGELAKRMSLLLMGGGMQAQGHAQLLINLSLGANIQQAIDMARFYHDQVPDLCQLETTIYNLVGTKLKQMGHNVVSSTSTQHGGAQIILARPQKNADGTALRYRGRVAEVFESGTDLRKDGVEAGY
jgi:gamma-glutamyltranspeptidase / glutathione hydrolase